MCLGGDMASPNAHLVNKLQLSYETSVKRRSFHPFGKNKAKTRLFSKAGPAFKGFHYDEVYDVHHFRLVSLIESDENDEKLLEKKLLTIHGLSCDRCTLAFSSKNHLEKHLYFCGNPNVVAGDLKLLKKCKGFLQEEDGGMLFCPWCPILSSNMVALLKHVRSCREARRERCERKVLKRLPCPECAIEFSHLQKLSNHMQSHYVADFTCNACKSSFSTANNLAKHLGECKSKQPYRCCDCNIYFRNIKPLQKHVLTCRTSVQCLKCAEIFPGKRLCVEHVVMHIFSEWSNIGLQMIDGVLYKILRHKLPQEDFLKPTLSRSPSPTISPCASPVQDPVKSQEKPGYASISIAGRPNPQLEKNFASSKALSSMDKSLPLLGSVKDLKTSDNFPGESSSHKSVPILTSDQRLGKNVAESGSIVKSIRTLKPVIRNCDPLHSAATDMLLANDDNLSAVIENDAFEIEDTLEDDFSIESEMCDSEPPLLPSEAGNSSKKFVETTIGPHHNHDVAKLFTPAIDIESGDSSELTLTVVNVEGGANLFNWDDCDTEEVGEIGDQQVDTYDPAEICNDMHLGAYSHHDANEDGDSGIGATDDSDSNKDKSEVSLKGDDKISNHSEMPPKLSIVPEKAVESSCSPVLPEVMLSAPSCDSEIVVESSPINQMEGMRSYSVMAEHSYSLGVSDAMQNINKQGKTSKVHSSERQGVEKKSQKVRNKKINEDGKSRQAVRKKCSKQLINENSRTADTSLTELDPLQRILEVMSKEARQTATKKPKSVKPSSVPKTASTPSEHPQLIGNTSAAFKEYLSSDENVLSEPGTIASANNVIPIQEEFSVSDHSSSHPTDSASQPIITSNFFQPIESITAPCEEQSYNETNVFSESGAFSFQNDVSSVVQADSVSDFALSHPPQAAASMFSNGSVEETKSSEKHFMEQEDTETHPEVPETISNLPPSEYISQKTLSQDEFIEKVKPAMSRNKILQKERSMLRHGFKQIATVLPQRKEHHLKNEAFSPNYCSKMPSLHVNLSTQTQKSAFAAVKATKPISNIIYIQLPPGVTPRCPEIPTTSNNVILAKLVPSTPISSTANRSSFSQNPLHFALQGPEHPRDVVSALVELGSDLVSQQNSVANEVNYSSVLLPPLSAISAGPASTFVENILEEAEGLPLRLGTGAHSGTESCPEVESEAISNHSSAVNEILNAPALPTCSSQSQEVVCSEEIVPRMPTKENGNELKRDSSMLRKSKPSERKFIKLGSLCNTITNLEEKVPLIKSGLNVTILPHAGEFSLPVFHSLNAEETVLSEGNLPPIKEISHTPPNNAEEDLRNESAMLKSKQLDSSHLKKEALGLNRMKNVPLLTHNSAAANLFDASDIVPLQNSTLNPQFSEQTVCSKENLPPVEEASHMHYLNEPKKDLKMESTMLPKSKQSEIKNFKLDNRDDCRINYEESSALLQSKYLIKSSAKQLGTKNESEAVLVKLVGESLPETTNCKIVEENEKQVKAEDTSKMTVPENPEKDFENDVSECVDSTLDHEIKALISCLDSNIASEETRNSADSSGQFFRQKDSVTEKLVSPLPKHDTVQTLNDTTKEKDSTKKFNLVQQKSFKVCQMQLCSSSNEDELLLNTFTTGENSKEDSGLLKINDDCVSTHKMRTRISQFRTNLYVSRKLMSEMKCFKRNKFGREGVHRSENVSTYNCNCCSQWFYSEVSLRSHTCLKAIIREKFNSEQFDELIARVEKTVLAQELVQLNNQVEGQQTECAQNLGHVNEESGADESTSNSATTQMSPYLSYLQMKTNVRHKKFICDKCNVRCKSFSALLEHKSSVHDEKYSVECHICGKKFSRLQQLAVHVAKSHKVTNPSMKRPVQSVKTNLLKSNLSRKTVVRLIKRRLERSGLSKAVPRINNQIFGEKALHLAENCTAQGNVSKDDFNTALGELLVDGTAQKGKNVNSEQWQEENLVITGISHPDSLDKSSQCSICNKRFKGKIGLTSHMVQAHRENQSTSAEDDITECSICKKLFKGKNGLTSHINQAHRETFKCPLCLRRFCYIQTLKFHLSNQHSSSLNTDALPPESVEPEGMMQLPSSESVEVPVQENGGSSDLSDKSSLGTLDAKDCDGQMPSANVSKSDLKKPTITKWKFVQEFSPEKIHEPPAEESVNVEDYVSSKERITKKVKKIKWRIVKDTSPEKIPPSERPAKSPRLSDGNIEPVPPLVIAFSKVKKHRHKCRICRKHFKKHYHLLQHQMVAHKFRSQLQLERHVEQCQSENKNEKLSTSTLVENQQSITPATLSNCLPNVIIGEIDLCSADKKPGENGSELGNPEKVQCSSANIATVNTGSSAVESTPSVNVEKSPQEETVLSAPDEKPQEENSASDSASIMLPKEKLQNAPNGKFECEICQIEFSAKGYFERHNIKIHGAPCKFSCPLCDKIFTDRRSLRFHTKTKHRESDGSNTSLSLQSKCKSAKERKCEQCNKKFRKYDDLRNHTRKVHKIHRYKCCSCSLSFKTEVLLAAHKVNSHSKGSEEKNCDLSTSPNKSYDDAKMVNLSVQSVNEERMTEFEKKSEDLQENSESLKCSDCSLTYKLVSCLKRHRILMHGEQATHQCDVCGKGFSYPHSLKTHMLTHSRNESPRTSRRLLRRKGLPADLQVPGPNLVETEVKQGNSTSSVLKNESIPPNILSSEITRGSEVSGDKEMEENISKSGIVDKQKQDQDIRSNTSNDDDSPHCRTDSPLPLGNTSQQEDGPSVFSKHIASDVSFNTLSPPNCTVPEENYSMNNSCAMNDALNESPDPVKPDTHVSDPQWSSTPEPQQYQMPPMAPFSAPLAPLPSVTPSFDQIQAFNTCTLCGLCVPSWQALQEHYYVFHSYQNYYAAAPTPSPYAAPSPSPYAAAPPMPYAATPSPMPYPAPPTPMPYPAPPTPMSYASPSTPSPYAAPPTPMAYAAPPSPMPYAASLGYPTFQNENPSYGNWTVQQPQFTNISQSTGLHNGASSFQELSSQSGVHCSLCGLVFPSLCALQAHYSTHMAVSKPTVQHCSGFY